MAMTRWRWAAAAAFGLAAAIYFHNASWLAPVPEGRPQIIAHRGVHQQFSRDGLKKGGCTADRIHQPTHAYLENTAASMAAAFKAGADRVEIDIHPTADGHFVVFHDWALECRTDGKGVTREQSLDYLQSLDIGHGYTADGGQTFPFRGKAIGQMPELDGILRAFPGKRFLINFKSRDANEADRLIRYLRERGMLQPGRIMVYGNQNPVERFVAQTSGFSGFSHQKAKACTIGYLLAGWSGFVPAACRGGIIIIPVNYQWAAWGWPNRFLTRMKAANATPILVSADGKGLTKVEEAAAIPQTYNGAIWVDDVRRAGPAVRARWP